MVSVSVLELSSVVFLVFVNTNSYQLNNFCIALVKYLPTCTMCVRIKAKQVQFLNRNNLFNLNGTFYMFYLQQMSNWIVYRILVYLYLILDVLKYNVHFHFVFDFFLPQWDALLYKTEKKMGQYLNYIYSCLNQGWRRNNQGRVLWIVRENTLRNLQNKICKYSVETSIQKSAKNLT